jgi:hypothetical protein
MKPLWTVEKAAGFELKQYAREVLDTAIECLKEDNHLQSGVFVVTKSEIHCLEVAFEGQTEKTAMYARVVQYARDHNAEAIVTLKDAYWGPEEAAFDYYPGNLQEGGKEMIQVAVTGPELTNWTIEAKYHRKQNRIDVQLPEENSGGSINFLGDWPANLKSVN